MRYPIVGKTVFILKRGSETYPDTESSDFRIISDDWYPHIFGHDWKDVNYILSSHDEEDRNIVMLHGVT